MASDASNSTTARAISRATIKRLMAVLLFRRAPRRAQAVCEKKQPCALRYILPRLLPQRGKPVEKCCLRASMRETQAASVSLRLSLLFPFFRLNAAAVPPPPRRSGTGRAGKKRLSRPHRQNIRFCLWCILRPDRRVARRRASVFGLPPERRTDNARPAARTPGRATARTADRLQAFRATRRNYGRNITPCHNRK